MQFDDVTDDGKSDSQPSMLPRAAAVGLLEAIEHIGQESGVNSRTVIGYSDAHRAVGPMLLHRNVAALLRKLDRVGQKVSDHLQKPVGIGVKLIVLVVISGQFER